MNLRPMALSLFVVVCSVPIFEATASSGGPPRRPAAPVVARHAQRAGACVLLLKADVEAAFAPRVFKDGEKGVGDFAGTAKYASVSSCMFTSKGASFRDLLTVGLVVRRAPTDQSGVALATAKEGAVKLKMTPVDVPGLGDAAYWVNSGTAKRPNLQLNVLKGKRLWLIFGATAAGLEIDKALAGLTKVAQATLPRL